VIKLAHRLVLTEKCNFSCPHCFNANERMSGIMDADILLEFMRKNKHHLDTYSLKLMGGEPTLHPRFMEIFKEACKHYGEVYLFTNGSTMKDIANDPIILKNHLMGRVIYVINGFTFNLEKFEEYRDFINIVSLHFVVPMENVETMIDKVIKCFDFQPNINLVISPDTQVNLFDEDTLNEYRSVWMKAITTLVPKIRLRGMPYIYDHVLPICFYNQEMLDYLHSYDIDNIHTLKITCCGDQQLGLIDHNFDIYYCNQTRIKIGSLLNEVGQPKILSEVEVMLQAGSSIKTEAIKNECEKCSKCPVVASCKVGCYYNTLVKSNE